MINRCGYERKDLSMQVQQPVVALAQTVMAVCALALMSSGCSGSGDRAGFAMPPMSVEASDVTRREIVDRFEVVGTIEALAAVTVVGEIDALVTALPFAEGSTIHKGDLIARLDDGQLAAEVARAEALGAQTRASFDRVKSIVSQGAGSPQDLDDASAALKVAEANLDLARARFAKTRIVAPFNGVIGSRRVSVGTFLRAGQPITDLANVDEMRVTFSAPERFLGRLKQGAAVVISTPAFPDTSLQGQILVVDPMIDEATRTARVVARVQNPSRKFRPGMSANITAVLNKRAEALTIPNEAVFGNGGQSFVYVIGPDSTVHRTAVTLGTRTPDVVEVLHGLAAGTRVVRAGHQKLFDGGKVMPVMSDPRAAIAPVQTGG
jgi:membrane fusion protein, multidrug efflux system